MISKSKNDESLLQSHKTMTLLLYALGYDYTIEGGVLRIVKKAAC